MAINQLLYTTNVRGGIITTGNTLGLWGRFNPPNPNATLAEADGIGTFTTNNTALQYDGYPAGTTTDWTQNQSSNVLSLPTGSTVLKAYLFYSATQINSVQNVTSFINLPVSFTNSNNVTTQITPDNVTTIVDPFASNSSYHARKDVTSLLTGAGTYTLSAVPGVLGLSIGSGNENNFAGWSLVVVFSNSAYPYRNLTVWDEFAAVYTNNPVDIPVSGFTTPTTGSVNGKFFTSVGSGDNYISGDQLLFGPNAGSLAVISGPNNGAGNFFQSQINDDNGNLSTTGTFGSRNQPFGGSAPAPVSPAARQGWDKTAVDVSSELTNNQTSALIRLNSTGDVYFPQYAALQVDLNSATLVPFKSVDKTAAIIGDTLTYKITFTNNGTVEADNVVLTDLIPNGTSYVNGSVSANVPFTGIPATGVTLTNSVQPGETVTVTFKVLVISMPNPNPIPNTATLNYTYIPASGSQPVSDTQTSNTVTTIIFDNSRGVEFI